MTAALDDAPAEVQAVFDAAPEPLRGKLLALRWLILDTAAETEGVGKLTETLKWGEPAYLTEASGSGSTIRIGWKSREPDLYRLLVHCQTDLVEQFRARFGDQLRTEGARAILLDAAAPPPDQVVAACIRLALTYHRRRRMRR